MHLFDANDILQKYDNITDIIDSYYEVRLKMYQERKNFMMDALQKELILLSNKAKYIQENLDGTIDLRKKKKEQVVEMLQEKGYDKIQNDEEYKYLVKMPMDSVTEENVEKLLNEKCVKETELEIVKTTTINKMWMQELDALQKQYFEYKEKRSKLMNGDEVNTKTTSKKVTSKGIVKKTIKKSALVVEDN
jgi:DNA topoisomerase-2